MHNFEGGITFNEYENYPLNIKNLLLRCAYLKDTEWIIGMAIYTGWDSKIIRLATTEFQINIENKISKFEWMMNKYIFLLILVIIVLSFSLSIC